MSVFDYTEALRRTCVDICFRVAELQHIDMEQVGVSFARTKNIAPFGIYASTYPLRFEDGKRTIQRNGRWLTHKQIQNAGGVEYLYIINFYMPRFIDLKFNVKLETIIHELYHISPYFNGDLRRFGGRCFAHGKSQKQYDKIVLSLMETWLKQDPAPELWDYLKMNYNEINQNNQKITGTKFKIPKIVVTQNE
ncbi:MAG: hypothetical protein LBU65_07810 [Planctomycetaceae bacterium]|jgi:predicted metallopeptidase|nr:hypothetical protein [Planctomycetaceae bacterium]